MDPHRQSLIPVFLTEQLERAANRGLHYAPVTRMQLARMKGKSLALDLQRPHFPLLMEVGRRKLHFRNHWEEPADVILRGPALALLRQLGEDNNSPGRLMSLGIEIEGDQALAQEFLSILRGLDLDFESILGDLVGDMAAHQISQVARTGFRFLRSTARTVIQQSRHLLVDEQDWIISPRQFTLFRDDVDTLREDCDRVEARLKRLQARLQQDDQPA